MWGSAAAVVTLGKAETIGQKVRICSASVLFGFWCIANKMPMIKEYLRRRCFVIMWRGVLSTFCGFCFRPAVKVHLLKLRSLLSSTIDRETHRKTAIIIVILTIILTTKIHPAAL